MPDEDDDDSMTSCSTKARACRKTSMKKTWISKTKS